VVQVVRCLGTPSACQKPPAPPDRLGESGESSHRLRKFWRSLVLDSFHMAVHPMPSWQRACRTRCRHAGGDFVWYWRVNGEDGQKLPRRWRPRATAWPASPSGQLDRGPPLARGHTPLQPPATLQPCGGVSEMYASAMQLGSYIETSLGQLWERIMKWLAVGLSLCCLCSVGRLSYLSAHPQVEHIGVWHIALKHTTRFTN